MISSRNGCQVDLFRQTSMPYPRPQFFVNMWSFLYFFPLRNAPISQMGKTKAQFYAKGFSCLETTDQASDQGSCVREVWGLSMRG